MKTLTRSVVALAAGCLVLAGLSGVVPRDVAEAAATEQLPDLQTVIPTDSFSVVQTSSGREFRYTHLVYDAGPGPLEIQPAYDSVSGGYRGTQLVYGRDTAGHWSITRQLRVPDTFVFHAEHGHFHFPLATFGLYRVEAGGGIGAPVAISPKNGFCIDDSYAYNKNVTNAGTFIGERSSCSDPNGLRGISVGGADEYDYRDPGQAVPIGNLADGTYWFASVTDPFNDFVEANEANNETDVLVTIAHGTVTAGTVRHPDTTPPTGTVTAPVEGGVVHGTTTLSASTADTDATRVDFVVDGEVVGSASTAPYRMDWSSSTVSDGSHWLSARVTDRDGRTGSTPVTAVTVANAGSGSAISLDGAANVRGAGTRTASLSQLHGGDVLLALVSSDGPSPGTQTSTVGGTGLTWRLVRRANGQPGTSEIWTATLPDGATTAAATSTPHTGGLMQSLTLLAFRGAAGVGASATAGATTGAPVVGVTTSAAGGWVFGVGNDWDGAVARTLLGGQTIVDQWVDGTDGDTFWSQSQVRPTTAAGSTVRLGASAPTDHHWNLAAVEVVPDTTSTGDHTPPLVSISDPEAGTTLAGPVRVAATAADENGVTSVSFLVDGRVVGTSTQPPFLTEWDTSTVTDGRHALTAEAHDPAGNVGTSPAVQVTVDNSGPPPAVIGVDTMRTGQGSDTLSVPTLSTASAGELLVAYVGYGGPTNGSQTARVEGARLRWTLVKRSNTEAGTSEIWTAYAPTRLHRQAVTARPGVAGYPGMLTVAAYTGTATTGVASAAGAASGGPSIYLPGVLRGSWAFAVGNDPDGAVTRTPATGQPIHREWADDASGQSFWVQSMPAPNTSGGLDTISDPAPTAHRWNYAAVELRARPGS